MLRHATGLHWSPGSIRTLKPEMKSYRWQIKSLPIRKGTWESLCPSRCTHSARERNRDRYREQVHRIQWESVLSSVSVQYEHLHTILNKQFFICLSIRLSIDQFKHTITGFSIFFPVKKFPDFSCISDFFPGLQNTNHKNIYTFK